MRSITLKSTGTAWALSPGAKKRSLTDDLLIVRDVPDNISDAAALHVANMTAINTPTRATEPVAVDFARLGAGRLVNLVIGRPVGSSKPPAEQTKPRSVRLNDARWDRLKALGSEWLEHQIDRAKLPAA